MSSKSSAARSSTLRCASTITRPYPRGSPPPSGVLRRGRLLEPRARGSLGSPLVQQARLGGGDLAQRRLPALEARRRRGLTWLERLVDVKELVYLAAQMGRHVTEVPHLVEARIAQGHADDLCVRALLVFHPENADWPGADPAPGEDRLL